MSILIPVAQSSSDSPWSQSIFQSCLDHLTSHEACVTLGLVPANGVLFYNRRVYFIVERAMWNNKLCMCMLNLGIVKNWDAYLPQYWKVDWKVLSIHAIFDMLECPYRSTYHIHCMSHVVPSPLLRTNTALVAGCRHPATGFSSPASTDPNPVQQSACRSSLVDMGNSFSIYTTNIF